MFNISNLQSLLSSTRRHKCLANTVTSLVLTVLKKYVGLVTCSITSIIHHATDLLKNNEYVIIISMDFSKAFDSVSHSAITQLLASLSLPDNIYNWLINYLQDRNHYTIFNGTKSIIISINASVVQGSVFGPTGFIVCISDLHPIHHQNRLSKYADDTYLLIGSNSLHTANAEIQHIYNWSKTKNLKINPDKTREMAIIKRNQHSLSDNPSITGVKRSTSIKILGVTIGEKLTVTEHINQLINSGSSSFFALRTIKNHGASQDSLHLITNATIISRTLYASPAWWGLISGKDKLRLEQLLNKLKRFGYAQANSPSIAELVRKAEMALFKAALLNDNHSIRCLFPTNHITPYSLRKRHHNFNLPDKDSRNFISRMLFSNSY